MAFTDFLLKPLVDLFNRLFGGTVIGRLVRKFTDGIQHILTLVDRIEQLIDSIKNEIEQFSHWKEDVRFSSRVINIPKAVEKIQELIGGFRDAWQAVLSIVQDLKTTIEGSDPQTEAEELASDLDEAGDVGESLLKRFPKLAQGLERVLGVVTLFVDAIIKWSDAVDKLQTIVDEVTRLREAVETGETIFLSQKNPRRTEALSSGGSIKIRVGKLHS